MSTRSVIYDAIVAALNASTGINYVTKDLEPWWEWTPDRFPGVCAIDGDAAIERFAYPQPTQEDMEVKVEFEVRAYVKDYTGQSTTLNSNRAELIADIEKALTQSTGIDDLVLDITPTDVQTDKGTIENHSIAECTYTVKYLYNHLSP